MGLICRTHTPSGSVLSNSFCGSSTPPLASTLLYQGFPSRQANTASQSCTDYFDPSDLTQILVCLLNEALIDTSTHSLILLHGFQGHTLRLHYKTQQPAILLPPA